MCNKLFKNPKFLPCNHSYCEECLEKMQINTNIICLRCRNKAIVPVGGVKNLPNNYFMDNLVNKLILYYKLEKTELSCEECDEDDPAFVFCVDCKLFLCCYCKESHKYSKSHCSHNLMSLAELRCNKELVQSKCEFPNCQKHDLELEYYCETCEQLVCERCTTSDVHEEHIFNVVKKFVNEFQNKIKEVAVRIEETTKVLSQLQDSIKGVSTTIRQQNDEISKDIDLYYDEVIEKLLEQKEQVKQQVRHTVLQKEKALTGQLEEIMHIQENILNIKRMKDAINSDQEVLSGNNQLAYSMVKLIEKCDELGFKPNESANVKVTFSNEPLPQIVKHFATIESLSFELNDFSSAVQQGQTVTLEIITKDSKGDHYFEGGSEVTAVVMETKTGMEITARTVDNNDGTYTINFVPWQIGEIYLSVFVNERKIKGSPFKIMVQEHIIKSSKIITKDDYNFDQLWGIACSNNGTWAVADWKKNCVYIFDSQDNLIKKLGNQGNRNGEFNFPCHVSFDNKNDLYVADNQNHRVQKFKNYGDYLLQFGGKGVDKGKLYCPLRITTHLDKVYVAESQNKRISVFQNDGKFCTLIGQPHLSRYFDIAVNIHREILVADWGHQCIHIFSIDGQYINRMIMHKENGDHVLKDPCSVTTDSNGFIIIADTNNHCIFFFDEIGNCIYCFGSNDQFKFPRGIAVAHNGNIYVSDTGNRRVQIFSLQRKTVY